MAVELWMGQEFDTSHEREAFDVFLTDMETRFSRSKETYFILTNYHCSGRQIDLTVLKRNAIIVVEFKECEKPFRAAENGDWLTIPDEESVGAPGRNPYEQVRNYRFSWVNLLEKRQDKFLPPGKGESMNFYHTSAFVAISPVLHPDVKNLIPVSPWFELIGLDELSDYVYRQASPSLNFTVQELRKLAADVLHLRPGNATSSSAQETSQPVERRRNPYVHFKESGRDLPYPANHHAADIDAIKRVIGTNNSLLVLGLSGSGKSSILRFLVSNPAVQSEDVVFVYIDCNLLDRGEDREAVQERMCAQIIEDLHLQNLGGKSSSSDIRSARQTLQRLIRNISVDGPQHLAVIFDRSELLQNEPGEPFFNYLRGLRDINPKMSYIFGGRDLDRDSFGELKDILWSEPYWIGTLSLDDAQMTIHRHSQRLGIRLKDEEIDKLLRCVGRHPQLLKYACELVQAKTINLNDHVEKVTEQSLKAPLIQQQCRDLWQDLDFAAQDTLRHLVRVPSPRLGPVVDWLLRAGVLERAEEDRVGFTSPIFKGYVGRLGPPPLIMEEGIVCKGSKTLPLSKEEFDLFKLLWDHQPQIVSADQISTVVWPDVHGEVTAQMITNLVKRLRDKLGDRRYINNVRGRGYQFSQGTAPLPRN